VVILDEFQKIPLNFLDPCLMLLSILEKYFNTTFIFSTATQPQLQDKFKEHGIKCYKVIKDYEKYFRKYKRVKTINMKERLFGYIIDKLIKENNNFLCVVNTRKVARDIYLEMIKCYGNDNDGIFLLSNYKTPVAKMKVIEEINRRLDINKKMKKGENKLRCIVVSTSCIEAGVDMDFPVVYSEICGIDSLVQRAGRCNREGLLDKGKFYVFKFNDRKLPSYIHGPAKIAQGMFEENKIDITSLRIIKEYYKRLYSIKHKEDFDKNYIMKKIKRNGIHFNFKSIKNGLKNKKGEYRGGFNLIPDNEYHIIINYDEDANNLIKELKQGKINKENMRRIQKYVVNIYENDFKKIQDKLHNIEWNKEDSKVKGLLDGVDLYYVNRDCYDENIGLIIENIREEEEH
jgi:CRISPR-associated endonuclease/helicase Cas3